MIWLAGAILLAGVVTGLFAGLFGIGGGAVIVPTAVRSYRAHLVRGMVIPDVIAGVIAAKFLVGREDWVLSDHLPGRFGMTGWGFLVGLASSLMGISGGSLATMVLTLYGRPIHNAVATGVGVPITIVGTLGYVLAGLTHQARLPPLSIGFVSVIGVVMIAPISSYAAPFGTRLAHAVSRRRLETGFGLFLLVVSARFVVSLIAPTD